jgi:hypothetical protein
MLLSEIGKWERISLPDKFYQIKMATRIENLSFEEEGTQIKQLLD